jgi:hypothetical protein
MSILNGNPSLKDMGLKTNTRNRLQQANIHDLEDILAVLDMSRQDLVKEKNMHGVVAKFTADAMIGFGLRRFGLVSQGDLRGALEIAQTALQTDLFSELVSQDDEASETITHEYSKMSNMSFEFFLDDSDEDISETLDPGTSESSLSDLENEDTLPLETLLIGVVVAKGLNVPPLMVDVVVDHVADFVTEDALDLSYKELDGVVAQHIKEQGWPVDAPIYAPSHFAKRYISVVAELSRIAAVVLTKTF